MVEFSLSGVTKGFSGGNFGNFSSKVYTGGELTERSAANAAEQRKKDQAGGLVLFAYTGRKEVLTVDDDRIFAGVAGGVLGNGGYGLSEEIPTNLPDS